LDRFGSLVENLTLFIKSAKLRAALLLLLLGFKNSFVVVVVFEFEAEETVDALREKLGAIDIDALSPRAALDLLYDLKREL
jgi:hypothetical protein